MQLTCPSCQAVYEAPDAEIGVGRTVECSACGARWFQPGEPAQAEGGAKSRMPGMGEAAEQLRALREPEAEGETAAEDAPTLQEAAREGALPPAGAEPAAAGLREPLRNPSAPQGEPAPGERSSVADIPIPPPPGPGEAAPGRPRPASIDAQRLTAELRAAEEEEPPRRSRGGFAAGFVIAVLISAAAAGAYLERDRLALMAPGLAPQIEAYAETVDSARRAVERAGEAAQSQLDPMIERLRQTLQGG